MYILVLISLFAFSVQERDKIKCADKLKIKTCSLYGHEGEEYVHYVKACSKNKVCATAGDVGTCVKPKKMRKEGDKCYSSVECEVGVCLNEKCTAKKEGDKCEETKECGLNLFCKREESSTCSPLVAKNEPCSGDESCQIGLVSDYSITDGSQKCVELFSKEQGQIVGNEKLCSTGFAVNGEYTDDNEPGRQYYGNLCSSYTIENETCAKKPDADDDDTTQYCKLKINDKTEAEFIECDENYNGDYICPSKRKEAFEKYKKLYNEQLGKLSKEDKENRNINRYTLGNEDVKKAYVDYEYYSPSDECIRDYYLMEARSAYTILPFSLILFLIISLF